MAESLHSEHLKDCFGLAKLSGQFEFREPCCNLETICHWTLELSCHPLQKLWTFEIWRQWLSILTITASVAEFEAQSVLLMWPWWGFTMNFCPWWAGSFVSMHQSTFLSPWFSRMQVLLTQIVVMVSFARLVF